MQTPPLDCEIFMGEPLKTYLEVAKELKSVPRGRKDIALTSTQSSPIGAQLHNCDATAGPGTSVNLIIWTKVRENIEFGLFFSPSPQRITCSPSQLCSRLKLVVIYC